MTTGEVVHAAVADTPITPDQAHAGVDSPRCGAIVGFSGVVRNHDGGRDVVSLAYSAHPSAERIIREVAEEIASRHDGVRIWVAHRVGPLAIGDQALVAAVRRGAPRRGVPGVLGPRRPGQGTRPHLEGAVLHRRQRGMGRRGGLTVGWTA
jgi:molybdopterin synthase catalytic subunit